mgnify:CR=1 FL=1
MKVKVNLNKLKALEKEIELISEQVLRETTSQGLPVFEAKFITGVICFDNGEFINLCLEATQKAYKELIFDVELVFIAKIQVACQNGLTWEIDVVGEPKMWTDGTIYFDKFEVV